MLYSQFNMEHYTFTAHRMECPRGPWILFSAVFSYRQARESYLTSDVDMNPLIPDP